MASSEPGPRQRGLIPATLAILLGLASVAAGGLHPAGTAEAAREAPSRAAQARFMWAMGTRESSRNYYARNRSSGAFGKYQIMPFNWPGWALEYVGDAKADQTPFNQEKVAFGKLRDLHGWLGSWRRVAYWWLTGKSIRNEKRWSSYARGYVDDIMRLRQQAPKRGSPMPRRTSSIARAGDWRRAATDMKLATQPGGDRWQRKGRIRDGQIIKVRASERHRGDRWSKVLTADGRLGWVKQSRTLPAATPRRPAAWRDIKHRGPERARSDRRMVRPRPR